MKGLPALEPEYPPPERSTDLAGTLHEVSNALTVVLGWLDAALPSVIDPAVRQALEVARAQAAIGHRLARGAIGAAVPPELERNALAVARDAVLAVTQEAKRAGVGVEFAAVDPAAALLADGATAQQILVNLLLNAIAFSPPGAVVTLGLEERSGLVAFHVTDQGPGVPAERVESILSGPVSTRRGGAGIGLTHSATLASERGARLRLVRPGPGAVFELAWPVVEEHAGSQVRSEPPVSLEGTRVLLVEDDANVLSLVEMTLEAQGVQVVSATCPDDLFDLLRNGQTFDAALVDFSPFETVEAEPAFEALALAVTRPGIILISGLARPVPEAIEAKLAQWVRKPFEMTEIVRALRRVVTG